MVAALFLLIASGPSMWLDLTYRPVACPWQRSRRIARPSRPPSIRRAAWSSARLADGRLAIRGSRRGGSSSRAPRVQSSRCRRASPTWRQASQTGKRPTASGVSELTRASSRSFKGGFHWRTRPRPRSSHDRVPALHVPPAVHVLHRGASGADRAPERGVIGRVRQGWPDHHNAAILATSIVRSSQT